MRQFLLPLSFIFAFIVKIRNLLYDNGLLKILKINIPVISIGNITAGGTGKTPITIFLAEEAKKRGFNPGIVSRGYGRESKSNCIIHDGIRLLETVDRSGDEPYLMGRLLKDVPIIVSKNRFVGAKSLLEKFDIDLIILDDAFQHRKIYRDLDILLINASEPLHSYKMLPTGQLRESLNGIKRADFLLITKGSISSVPVKVKNLLSNPILVNQDFSIKKYHPLNNSDYSNDYLEQCQSIPVFAFCGIGQGDFFINTLKSLNITLSSYLILKDHVKYTSSVINRIMLRVNKLGIKTLITTEKDVVKLPDKFLSSYNIYILSMKMSFSDESLDEIFVKLKN